MLGNVVIDADCVCVCMFGVGCGVSLFFCEIPLLLGSICGVGVLVPQGGIILLELFYLGGEFTIFLERRLVLDLQYFYSILKLLFGEQGSYLSGLMPKFGGN